MKHLILFIFLFLFSFTGCSYLGFKTQTDDFEETSMGDEDSDASKEDEEYDDDEEYEDDEDEDYEDDEEDEDEEDEEEDEDDEEYEDDEDEDYDDDEDEDEDEDEEEGDEDEDDEDESGGGISGFFKRLFGMGESNNLDEEIIDDEEGYEEESEYADEGEGFGEDSESYAEESSSSDITQEEGIDFIEDTPTKESTSPSTPTVVKTAPIKKNIPLQKIKTTPYQVSSYLVNGVYIARSNDSLESVSQKIYGTDQRESLYIINPQFKSRSVKVGDKIYYNSPNRPNDQSRLVIYYDDIGIAPSTYEISPGQNIRDVSSQLLGHTNSWKEIWATNPDLKSKWSISKKVIISYWPIGSEQARVPEPEPEPIPEPVPEPSDLSMEQEGLEEPGLSLPEAPSAPQFEDQLKKDYLSLIMKDKKTFAGIIGFFIFIILMIRMIFGKRRKEREFDYTSPNIKI